MQRALIAATAVLLVSVGLLLPSCCSSNQDLVVIASPEVRYDHNRERDLTAWGYTLPNGPVSLGMPVLARDGGVAVPPPDWVPRGGHLGEDGLSEARLFVLFSGVELPLSDEMISGVASDRSDLLDYLGTGPLGKVGLEASETQGAAREQVEAEYGEVLDMLTSSESLSGPEAVQAWADAHGAQTTFRIVDTRFPEVAFTSDRIAVGCGDFWFVLFPLPGGSGYSRLVVVPHPPGEQDFTGKTPTGG